MKRYTAILLIFALLACAAYNTVLLKYGALFSGIKAYQKTLYGDPAAAQDLEITFQTYYDSVNTQWTSTFSGDKYLSTEISKYNSKLDLFLYSQPSETVKDVFVYSFCSDEMFVSNSEEDRISGVAAQYGINYYGPSMKSLLNNITVSPALKMCFFTHWNSVCAFSYEANEETDDANDETFAPEPHAVYRTDSDKSIVKITVNRAQTELLVFSLEDSAIYLTRLDINTMDVLQTLYLFEPSDGDAFQWAADLSGGIAVLTDTRLHVFTEEHGVYSHAISVETDKLFTDGQTDWTPDYYDVQPLDILKETEYLSYKNGKLALAFDYNCTTDESGEDQDIFDGIWVLVCDENAVLYCGLYYDTILLSEGYGHNSWIRLFGVFSWITKPPFRVRWQ
ncbi:MAG: hypothetical protein IJT27_05820 [Clostridia bacterium]|nr:hypothetical protein [Clostridia bacterium]